VRHVPAPFPSSLPGGDEPLAGAPAIVLLGSGGWLPNLRAAEWFLRVAWPAVRAALPSAAVHVFGESGRTQNGPGIVLHGPLGDSRRAFAPNAVLVVPLPFGSGVRMKILEAWARGVPVVATPEAAEGLEADDGSELLLARQPEDFAAAMRRLAFDTRLGPSLVRRGRELLATRHDPASVASRLAAVYEAAGLSTPTP
jgi:glycosyltransferase involved in cell wall biosynthesis